MQEQSQIIRRVLAASSPEPAIVEVVIMFEDGRQETRRMNVFEARELFMRNPPVPGREALREHVQAY